MDFQYFRSFGKQQSSIDFDDQMTIFVGKNHTGKSNVMKFLEEIKLHDLPFNQAYKLHKSNWYNNESGIERPLKFRFEVELNDVEFHAFLNTWILNPIYDYFEKQL